MNNMVTAPRNRNWMKPTIVTCVIGLPILMILIPFISFRASNASAIRRLETKIKENKEPLTLADLAATYPPIPDEQNGAILLLEIWEKENPVFWKAFRDGADPLPERPEAQYDDELPFLGANARRVSRNSALPSVNLTAAKAFLQQQKEHMDGVRRALQRPHFRFPVQITNGFATLLPHLSEFRKEVQRFQIEALVATERGDTDAAIDALQQAGAVGKVAASEPYMLGHLVGMACHQIVLNGTERLLTRRTLSSQQLQKLERLVNEMQIPGGLALCYISERVVGLSAFQLSPEGLSPLISAPGDESGEASKRGYQIGMGLLKVTGIKDADRRFMLETMETAIALAKRGNSEALRETETLFGNVQSAAIKFPPKIYSGMLLPALGKAATKYASFEARRRAARIALAVEGYRLTHSQQLPTRLDQLVPQLLPGVPADPFNDEPLGFKRLPTGFVVYSVGVDRVDDGGTERPAQGGSKQFDDTFVVER